MRSHETYIASIKKLLSDNFGKKVYRIYFVAMLKISIKKKKGRKKDHTTLAMKIYYIFSREVTLPPWFWRFSKDFKAFLQMTLPKIIKTYKL